MNCHLFSSFYTSSSAVLFTSRSAAKLRSAVLRRGSRRFVPLMLGSAMLVLSSAGMAQITQGSGSSQQENRTSPMGSSPDAAASVVHESNKPQTKDGGSANARGKTAEKGHKAQGAGGFDNGLYGTGAGSNK